MTVVAEMTVAAEITTTATTTRLSTAVATNGNRPHRRVAAQDHMSRRQRRATATTRRRRQRPESAVARRIDAITTISRLVADMRREMAPPLCRLASIRTAMTTKMA